MKQVKPTGRIVVDYNDIVRIRACSTKAASNYLTNLRASLQMAPRALVTVHHVAADLKLELRQLLDCLGLPYSE